MLWGRSGNKCAICKHDLVVDATARDDESVVADECHIISSQPTGPRHDSSYPTDKLDAYENLVLLCRTHHKMVDDQTATFTTDILRQMKNNHEVWVAERLAEGKRAVPVRLRRVKQNIPSHLSRLTTGQEVLAIVTNAMAYAFTNDELKSQSEVDLAGHFLGLAQDWGEMSAELDANRRVQVSYDLTNDLQELDEADFLVFGGREVQLLEGGDNAAPSSWPVAIMRVLRKDNPAIARITIEEMTKREAQPGVRR